MVESKAFTSPDDQESLLKDAQGSVKRNAYFMKKALEEDNIREALRYSAAMLAELRTSSLSPQKYFDLYLQVFDELSHLEMFFGDDKSRGRTYAELYELVQHAGNILPRLYLMITVGCLYVRDGEVGAKEILRDLVDMCKGVQHPTRGLFLRAYLCQKSRSVLPDAGGVEAKGGSVNDSVELLLFNFIEMNKLWVRMQHQGSIRDRDRRERERQQLQDLVGKNLTYLSQLDGLDYMMYCGLVLPRVLEQVVSCKDDIAQQYLMQAVIQGFPDSFHLGTLDSLLGALPDLQAGVKVHALMGQLMDRLGKYAHTDPEVMKQLLDSGAFARFKSAANRVVEQHAEMMAADSVEMYMSLLNFTHSVEPANIDNVSQVLGACHTALSPRGHLSEPKAEKALVNLLGSALGRYELTTVLGLPTYPVLMTLLPARTHKDMAIKVASTLLDSGTSIDTVPRVEQLFTFLKPLMEDPQGASMEDLDEEEFEDEQTLVARVLHNLRGVDLQEHFSILKVAEARLLKGGPLRMRHTLPSLVFCTLQLIRRITSSGEGLKEVSVESMLQWLLEVCLRLVEVPEPMTAMRLLLCCASCASEEAHLELLAYDFFEHAFTIFEESIADSRQQVIALQAIVGTLHRCTIFDADNREALASSATAYSAKLLKRADQCRAMLSCSHLHWQQLPGAAVTPAAAAPPAAAAEPPAEDAAPPAASPASTSTAPPVRDSSRVMKALNRALKIANASKQQVAASGLQGRSALPLALHVEILNHYLYYLDQGMEMMTPSVVQQLIDLLKNDIEQAKDGEGELARVWANTCKHIEMQKLKEGDAGQRYTEIKL